MGLPETVPYLDWRWDDFVFLLLAGVMLGSALLVVLGRDIIRSALWLILSLAGLAGIYGLLGSPFMAISQVLVYMGAIAVLILFAVMITASKRGPMRLVFQRQWWIGAIAAIVLVLLMVTTIMLTEWNATAEVQVAEPRDIAVMVFEDYLLAFEALGVLLLAAVIGGLYLAKRDDDMPETNIPETAMRDEEEGA
ncbi:MAG: NADH-quinone oxidoreductase subunit J [Chloroflexota bacterium]|nr:NADH-quinone oxidoreductase subunit J [Chloroflexota bacterium]